MTNSNRPPIQHYNLQDLFARSKVMPNGCIEWQMSCNNYGYPRIQVAGKVRLVTRLVLKIITGNDGLNLMALHSCDNRKCISPSHLRWGTHEENMLDGKLRNRFAKQIGEKAGRSKLTEQQVVFIRSLHNPSAKELSQSFGVSKTNINNILNGKIWTYLLEQS